MPGILPAFFAAPQILSIACSTLAACTSCAVPPLSAVCKVVGADEEGIDAGGCRDRIDIGKRGCRFDHRERERALICLTHIINGGCAGALQRHGAEGTPAALPQRRIFRGGGELP